MRSFMIFTLHQIFIVIKPGRFVWSRTHTVELLIKFSTFSKTPNFVNIFTTARCWSLSWTRKVQTTFSHHNSLRSILILSIHLQLQLPSVFFSDITTKILYAFLSYSMHATCSAPIILLNVVTLILSDKKIKKLIIFHFSSASLYLPLFSPNSLLTTLFLNTF